MFHSLDFRITGYPVSCKHWNWYYGTGFKLAYGLLSSLIYVFVIEMLSGAIHG